MRVSESRDNAKMPGPQQLNSGKVLLDMVGSSSTPGRPPKHAQNALRRMATHETGEGVDIEQDGPGQGQFMVYDEDELECYHESHVIETGRAVSDVDRVLDVEKKAGGDAEAIREVVLQDQTNLLPTRQVLMVFTGLTAALFCSLLDQTIVTTAIPTLGRVFGRADISSWVGTSYLLTSTVMQPIYGRLSDIFGRKFVLLGALGIFLLGSLACALAQSMLQLIIFRAIQGLGGGGILTLSLIIISDVVSLKDRGRYQGINGCIVALSTSLGPVLGGIFTEKVSWRWCFYINLPLTSCCIVVIVFLLPLRQVDGSITSKLKQLDWYGSGLALSWAILILLPLSWGGSQCAWSSAGVLAPLVIGIFLFGLWIYVEGRLAPIPLVPLYLFKDANVAAAMVTMWLSGAAFYGTLYYLPTFFQVVQGTSAIRSGVLMLPMVLVQTVCSFASGMLVSKTGDYYWNLVIGYGCWTVGLGLLSSANENSDNAKLIGYQILIGFGAGQTFQTSLMAIQAAVARKDMAIATGMRNFMRQFGGMVALTICVAIVGNIVRGNLGTMLNEELVQRILTDPTSTSSFGLTVEQEQAVIHAYARAIAACFYFMTPCVGLSFFLTVIFTKKIPLERADDAEKKAEGKAWVESRKAGKKLAHGEGNATTGGEEAERSV